MREVSETGEIQYFARWLAESYNTVYIISGECRLYNSYMIGSNTQCHEHDCLLDGRHFIHKLRSI